MLEISMNIVVNSKINVGELIQEKLTLQYILSFAMIFDVKKDEIRQAINQIDSSLVVDNIEFVEDSANRHLIINMNINGKKLKMEV